MGLGRRTAILARGKQRQRHQLVDFRVLRRFHGRVAGQPQCIAIIAPGECSPGFVVILKTLVGRPLAVVGRGLDIVGAWPPGLGRSIVRGILAVVGIGYSCRRPSDSRSHRPRRTDRSSRPNIRPNRTDTAPVRRTHEPQSPTPTPAPGHPSRPPITVLEVMIPIVMSPVIIAIGMMPRLEVLRMHATGPIGIARVEGIALRQFRNVARSCWRNSSGSCANAASATKCIPPPPPLHAATPPPPPPPPPCAAKSGTAGITHKTAKQPNLEKSSDHMICPIC